MTVEVGRYGDRGVAEAVGDDFEVNTACEHEARMCVPQSVEVEVQTGFSARRPELLRQRVWWKRLAITSVDHEIVVVPRLSDQQPAFVLGLAVAFEHLDHEAGEAHRSLGSSEEETAGLPAFPAESA